MPSQRRKEFVGLAVALRWHGRVAVATFTRADELNSLSLEMVDGLRLALATAKAGRAVALVLTGEGRAFCVGAQLKLFLDERAPIGRAGPEWRDNYIAPVAELFDSFEEMPFPIIAAVNGYALGGGAEMAISSDFRIMARTAKLGFPETRLGATPGAGGVQKLVRHLGRTKALEWSLLGEHLSAEELDRAGLLYAVVEPDELIRSALQLAQKFCKLSPAAVAQAKRSVYVSEDADLRTARRYGVEALTGLMGSREWLEGVNAFLEKREPDFAPDED